MGMVSEQMRFRGAPASGAHTWPLLSMTSSYVCVSVCVFVFVWSLQPKSNLLVSQLHRKPLIGDRYGIFTFLFAEELHLFVRHGSSKGLMFPLWSTPSRVDSSNRCQPKCNATPFNHRHIAAKRKLPAGPRAPLVIKCRDAPARDTVTPGLDFATVMMMMIAVVK